VTIKKTSTKKAAAEGRDERPKELDAPEPKDKLCAEWRYWKLRQIEYAFGLYGEKIGPATYREAWDYCRALLFDLVADEDFWHIGHMLPLLPHLIISRQGIDRMKAYARRSRAGVKGAATRRAKAAKKGGGR